MSESRLPPQLPWRRFVCVLAKLGYKPIKAKRGSARTLPASLESRQSLPSMSRHGKDTLREGTLREYLRKLNLSRDEFLELLDRC